MAIRTKRNALLPILLAIAAVCGTAHAFETKYTTGCKALAPDQPDPNREKQKIQLLDENTYKVLSKVQDPIGKNQYDEAIAMLTPLFERNLKPFDKASVQHNLSFLYAQKQQWQKAIEMEKQAVDSNQLQESQQMQARQNIVYFWSATDNYAKTLDALKEYFANSWGVKPDMYILLSSIYAQLGKYQEAICPAYIAINKVPAPKQSWFNVALSAHYELKDWDGSITIAREMVDRFPNEKNNWNTLSSLYLKTERDQDALALIELANMRGFLEKESEFKNLASLYALNNVPYKSASVLEKAVEEGKVPPNEKNWKAIGQQWSLARESDRAIRAYGEAAKFVNDGQYFAYQGEIYSEQEKWKDASAAFQKAIEKGSLKDIGRTYLNLGISQFYSNDYEKALANLEKATQYEKSANPARQWINYVSEKRKAKQG